jgi:hypothetical protein
VAGGRRAGARRLARGGEQSSATGVCKADIGGLGQRAQEQGKRSPAADGPGAELGGRLARVWVEPGGRREK